ncbi:MAG TPA: Rieske 2Fe-2S domain-containing protein [Dehalococcoidia bacterium]|nr:Rieske 2Fe-2S domain-containing protein [Dehalococcoidia bacterium]
MDGQIQDSETQSPAAAESTAAVAVRPGAPVPAAATPAASAWRIRAAGDAAVTVARPRRRALAEARGLDRLVRAELRRRQVLRGGALGAIAGFLTLGVGSFLNFFNPRHTSGFGGTVRIPASQVPKPGDDPLKIFAIKGFLVNLKPGEGGFQSVPPSKSGGLVALYQKCPHLGCAVPWRPDFQFGGSTGWFRCPCHGSTYTKGGLRVFGPAPRSLDTFALVRNSDGSVTVDTGKITLGGLDDPQRGSLPPA